MFESDRFEKYKFEKYMLNPYRLGRNRFDRARLGKIGSLLALCFAMFGCSAQDASASKSFSKFSSIYEPSGVQQLADGRFLVVQDESAHPFDLFLLQPDGSVEEAPLYRSSLFSWVSANRGLSNFEDLEGIASDDAFVYAITSHSRKDNGKRDNAREQLVRFQLEGEQSRNLQSFHGLHKIIADQYPSLKSAVKERDVKEEGGFNIEGLSFDAKKQKLLIGLRAPLTDADEAIIVVLNNPDALFETKLPELADQLIRLDLDGGGIRGLTYDPHLGGYLIISARPGKSFKLWLWVVGSNAADGLDGARVIKPKRIKIAGVKNLHQAEGVSSVQFDARPQGILIVSDEGNGISQKAGRYVFIRYQQLKIE